MKIFQINTVCGTGSTGRIVVDIARVLKKAGDASCIAYGRGAASMDVDSYKIDSSLEVYTHAFLSRLTDRQGLYSSSATRRLIQKIKEYDPDIIHLHNIHGYYLNYKILFRFLAVYNKPVVWTLHDCWAFTGHCAYFDFIGCEKWKTGCHHCPQLRSYPTSYLLDHSKENYQLKKELITQVKNLHIVTPSQWLADLVKQSFLSDYDVTVIHNGIDVSVFKPTESDFRANYGLQDKKVILGVASPWTARKGLQDFIQLADMLDESMRIVLVGLNKNQRKALPKSIIGIERTNNAKELAAIYTAADVFFNPTYEDNYPTTNLEALACGTPVVTYRTGGSPESVDVGCGVIIEKHNLNGFIGKINKLINITIKNNVLMKFDKNKAFQRYLQLYSKLQKAR